VKRLTVPLILAALALSALAHAQEYSFSIPEMELHVTANKDASIRMEYMIKFHCNTGAHEIDVVDIGLPDYNYDTSNMTASLDGEQLYTIRKSTELTSMPAVEVHLTPAIAPGQTGVFRFECTMPDRIYQDTTNKANASLRITPTWYGSQYVTGGTQLSIVIYLPDEVDFDNILYQLDKPFSGKIQVEGRKAVAWYHDDIRMTGENMVGVSFPKDSLDRVVHMSNWQLFMRWWNRAGTIRFLVGVLCLVFFGILFYRISRGTGSCLFIPLIIFLIVVWAASAEMLLLFVPFLILLWIVARHARISAKRNYLPAIASVPGGEIKRGLAVPEAAVMMEEPLGRVLTFVIFGLLKKQLIVQTREEPLTVALVEGYDTRRRDRRRVARERGTTIRGFEQDFLDVIGASPGVAVNELDFATSMRNLITNTAKRLAGFDVARTREYYESIMKKAWTEAEDIGDLTERTEYVDSNLGWLMMHNTSHRHFDTWHHGGYRYRPTWTRPGGTLSAPSMPTPEAPGTGTSGGDVAASFSGWMENVTGGMARSMDPVSIGLRDAPGISLAGVDKVGGAFLKAMSESSGKSGGGFSGGGGCACACAGCACACACAGGGR